MKADTDRLLRAHRRRPLARRADFPHAVDLGREELERMIPHREPFLLVDRIEAVDLENERILGVRRIEADDAVFRGHFPGEPVYPGSLQLEMAGQLSLCLAYFTTHRTVKVNGDLQAPPVRITRVLGAYFVHPVPPGTEVTLLASRIDGDEFFSRALLQTTIEDSVCCTAVIEVCFPTT
ncbi:MAG TPA: 3-hydroxyacyl-ACP dehydratase FabZ family protein [Candidatus Latescibacteria bacterium]|nr:3-hydroxyacyl-ACP dehydratase FabZ family protein [Candidatus Latescibacterota bacterium]HJP29911.1 3-hydroxyacyl-ACP dehydratase FabZ family protein [Candidatus Latescibacterota bacterium]